MCAEFELDWLMFRNYSGWVDGWMGGWSGGEWIIVLAQLGWVLSLAIKIRNMTMRKL